jgi:uncharacterized membrane protein
MTMTATYMAPERSGRWLLIVSLALNLFFIGSAGALAVRHFASPPDHGPPARWRTAAGRIERLAAPLPPADAEKLRAAYHAQALAAEGSRDAVNRALEHLQAALRKQPFDPAELRTALNEIRTTRPAYEQVMSDIYFTAVVEMSAEGRIKLADWPQQRPGKR